MLGLCGAITPPTLRVYGADEPCELATGASRADAPTDVRDAGGSSTVPCSHRCHSAGTELESTS